MTIYVAIGEWINTLQNRMATAADGDVFCLPTPMHLHAFFLAKENFPGRDFKVEVLQGN